mgnify:CR=1 FL=1
MKKEKYILEHGRYLQVSIDYKDDTGARRTYTKGISIDRFSSPKEAMAYAKALRDQALMKIHNGAIVYHAPTIKALFAETHRLYVTNLETWRKHENSFRAFASIEGKPIDKVTTADLQGCVTEWSKTHSYEQTSRTMTVIHNIYKAAYAHDLMIANRANGVAIPQKREIVQKKKVRSVPEDTVQAYLTWLAETDRFVHDLVGRYRRHQLPYIIKIITYTGMQPAEVYALDRSDIDLSSGLIHITKQVGSNDKENRVIVAPKKEARIRDIPICDDLRPILIDYLSKVKGDHLFYDYDGLPYDSKTIPALIGRTAKQANVSGFHLYQLRHNFANRIAKQPAKIQTALLGHENFTQSVDYQDAKQDELKKAIQSIDRPLSPTN